MKIIGLLSLALVGSSWATTYYVALWGNDNWSGTSPDSAWRHIAYGTQQIQAGDSLIILSGNYGNENAVIAHSGTPTDPIVIRGNVYGEVIMEGDGNGDGIRIEGNSHIIIENIKFTNYSSGIFIYHEGSYITVRRCIFIENTAGGFLTWGTSSDISKCHHLIATENWFSDYTDKQDYGIYFCYATDVVANNNYFFGWHHQALSFKRRIYYGIAKNNIFEGFHYTALYLGQNLDAPGDTNRCRYLIAEGNVFRPAMGYRAKRPIWVSNVEYAVVRNNFMEGKDDIDGGWGEGIALGDYESGYEPANPSHVTIYNNVMRRIGGTTTNPGIRVYDDCHDVRVFNNTFAQCAYNLGFEKEDTLIFINNIFWDYYVGMLREGTGEYCIFKYNDIYPWWSGAGATNIFADPLFVAPFDTLILQGENPHFIPDFSRAEVCRLQEGSPCIDAGVPITKTVGSGNGNEISVEDAGYFTDGFGISDGDLIRVGAYDSLRIVDIDYESNIITIDQVISWNNGDGVSLAYYGSAPDMGTYEYRPVGVEERRPESFALCSTHPNPFNSKTTINYSVVKSGHVELKIYSISGQLVRTLVDGWKKAGIHSIMWDGKDDKGKRVASGIYLCCVKSRSFRKISEICIIND